MTRVVNLRLAPYDVYIGRAGKGQAGTFGNPVAIGKTCPVCKQVHTTAGATLTCYEYHARARLRDDPAWAAQVKKLHGKTLGCFCKSATGVGPCHGDVLARLAAELNVKD